MNLHNSLQTRQLGAGSKQFIIILDKIYIAMMFVKNTIE